MGVFSWSPSVEGTQVFFILSLKFFAVDSKEASNGMTIGSAIIY